MLFFRSKKSRTRRALGRKNLRNVAQLSVERLEKRDLLAIVWANEFVTSGPDDTNFDTYALNETIARQIVKRAISDWNAVITSFNYAEDLDGNPNNNLNNTFNLTLVSEPLGSSVRGDAQITSFNLNGAPYAGRVRIDDNGAGAGWFFDQTVNDDAEFTGIVNSREKRGQNYLIDVACWKCYVKAHASPVTTCC